MAEGAKASRKRLSSDDLARRLAEALPELADSEAALRPARSARPLADALDALTRGSPEERVRAAQDLASKGAPGAPEAMIALRRRLTDDERAVRSAAAIALIRLGDAALLDEMVKSLADPSPKSAAAAATALGIAGNQAAVPHLIAAFRTHDLTLGAAIAAALAALNDRRAVAPLMAALKADFVPTAVCLALGRLGDAAAAPVLVRALAQRDARVRAHAARALGLLREAIAAADFPSDRREKLRAALRKLLDDADRKARLSAALALVELGEPGAGAQLVRLLDETPARRRATAHEPRA